VNLLAPRVPDNRYAAGGSSATIHFSVRQDAVTGDTTGRIDFSGPVEVTPGNFVDATFKADVNCAVFLITDASLSGVVTDSSMPALIVRPATLPFF
jgi:hypothetical protein